MTLGLKNKSPYADTDKRHAQLTSWFKCIREKKEACMHVEIIHAAGDDYGHCYRALRDSSPVVLLSGLGRGSEQLELYSAEVVSLASQ